MKVSPPTQLVVFMFLSFAVVLGTMIVLFRPGPVPRIAPSASLSESSAQSSKALAASAPADTAGQTAGSDTSAGLTPASPVVSRSEADQERAELNLLKTDIEGRLKAQMAIEDQKIAHLARLCAGMEPGQAAATISSLDDATVHRILSQLDKDSALKIQSVLVRIRKGNG